MNHHRIILISSFAIALTGGFLLSIQKTQAAELIPSIINVAMAKEETTDTLSLDQRKALLQDIVTTSQTEIQNLKDALNDLKLDGAWDSARDQFLAQLATSTEYYTSLGKRVEEKDVALDDIKAIAKELKDWRENVYTAQLKAAGNMILIFQTDDVRRIVQSRNEKIGDDIKKLDRQKLVNTDALKKYLSQADKSIKNATALNAKAKDLYYKESIAPLQPKDARESDESDITVATSSPSLQEPSDRQDDIRDLSKEALKELKNAYELFFKMNDRIRK